MPREFATARAAAQDTPRMAFAPNRDLLLVPSSSIMRWSMARWSSASRPRKSRARCNRQIRQEIVFSFAGPGRDHRAETCFARPVDHLKRFCQSADLVHLYQDCIGRALANAAFEPRRVRDKQVVADELDLTAQLLYQRLPARPVVLRLDVLN